MRNIVGQTPRGEDFYPRNAIINRIYRRLSDGSHLFLSAPRRSGKTSIMRALEDFPKDDFLFLYLTVEDCIDSEGYFKRLSEELMGSTAVGKLSKLGEKAKTTLGSFFDRIKKIKVSGFEIETTNLDAPTSYFTEFESLLRNLDTEGTTVCIMVDEFPVALEAISKANGTEAAVQFLHLNRGTRQRAKSGIRFIYTGSIGLPNIARRLGATSTINDLNVVEIPPLTREEGLDMSKKIFANYKIVADDAAILAMLDRIEWLMPFFIQLVIQLLIDEIEAIPQPLTLDLVEKILAKAANHRSNIYFENYLSRLDKTLPTDECATAKEILADIATKGHVKVGTFGQKNAQAVLETLEYDGYIHEQGGNYRFNSPILKSWWLKNA